MSSASRERILARIGSALKTPSAPLSFEPKAIFPPIGNLAERFQAECKGNYTECVFVDVHESTAKLKQVLASVGSGSVFAEDAPRIRELLRDFNGPLQWSSEGRPLESSVATISRVEALIAATGSLLVTSSCGGRGASIVAPVHIVIANANQLVPDIESALDLANERKLSEKNSYVGVITGCSRTADIEKLLVIGAHGPKRLAVIVENS